MDAYAIIGAGFGDEGKGASVDALVHSLLTEGRKPVVVRSGSGAQAAHTVQFQQGETSIRHVFGHIGSGTLSGDNGAPTWLGPRFVHNPPLFLKEHDQLRALGANPVVFADLSSTITLPVDVAINQGLERSRGRERHGSCGIGFGEAVGRSEHSRWRVTFSDLRSGLDKPDLLRDRLVTISHEYAEERLSTLDISEGQRDFVRAATERGFIEAWMADALSFARIVEPRSAADISSSFDVVVFEGAQGLLLDRDAAFFPHVTRSRTGLPNVIELLDLLGINRLEAIYVTRSYATRHGAGPLPGEGLPDPNGRVLKFHDGTNVPNPYQKTLRFSPHVPSLMGGAIMHDLTAARHQTDVFIKPRLAVTCLDQTEDKVLVLEDGETAAISPNELLQSFGGVRGWLPVWIAVGEGREQRSFPATTQLIAA